MSYTFDVQENSLSVANVAANMAAVIVDVALRSRTLRRTRTRKQGSALGRTFRHRNRRSVKDIYNELGEVYFRRAYRMMYRTFLSLSKELCPYIMLASGQKGTARYVSNGPVPPDVQLSCALRWIAGGFPYDIMTTYGIGHHTDTINS